MYCGNCGTENAEGVKFCKNCGKPVVGQNKETADVKSKTDAQSIVAKLNVVSIIEKIKNLPKKVLIGVCCAVVALLVIISVVVNDSSTINLDNYITVETTGYNGYGRANIYIDWNAIEEKYSDKISFTSKAKNDGLINIMTPFDVLESDINASLDSYDKISNGDVLNYTWAVDEEISEYVKCKVKYKDSTYTVSGLEEVGTFDAFADLSVTFEGISPNAVAQINYTGSDLSSYDFTSDKTSALRNGDTVTVSLDENYAETYAENLGKIPSEFEKTYTVEGIDEYISSYSDLTEDFITTLKKESEDTIYSYTANSYNDNCKLSDLSYAGYIELAANTSEFYGSSYNYVFMIYKGTVSSTNGDFEATNVYYPVGFSNILLSNGSLSYENNNGVYGSSNLGDTWYGTEGYVNPLTCYLEIVENNVANYSSECGDGFEQYGDFEMISKLSDITDDEKIAIYADAKAQIEAYIASDYNSDSIASDLTFVGEYMLVAKNEMSDVSESNKFIAVYSANISNSRGNFEPTTAYFPVEYDGIAKMGSGEYVIFAPKGIQGHTTFANSYYSTKGFLDGTMMYDKLINSNRDNYTYEISEGLTGFGN